MFREPLGHEKQLVVCGGGHVGIPLVKMGRLLGLPVTVVEDRPAFAESARAAGATRVVCAPFEAGLTEIPGDADTFFVIATRGHFYDMQCLEAISRKPHAYIGMIGSRRRVALVRQTLVNERGCDAAVIDSVRMPVGLDIGAETPEEIAVAILAQVIEVKNRSGRNAAWPRELIAAVLDPEARQTPRVLASVVARRGSAPRGIGARMLVWPDGRIFDTIGGGVLENAVIQSARARLEAGERAPGLYTASLTADAAAREGMACGGEVTVLMETIEADEGNGRHE